MNTRLFRNIVAIMWQDGELHTVSQVAIQSRLRFVG